MSRLSISTPRTDKKQHTPLSLDELNDISDSDSNEQMLITEISTIQTDIQNAKRQKRTIDLKIEGLQHDLKCAEKARELGNGAAANIAAKLAAIFGEALKEEDLVIKVQQLQERAKNARQEVETLTAQLANLKISTPQKLRSSKRKVDQVNDEIQKAKLEEQKVDQQIIQVDNEIEMQQNQLRALNQEIDELVYKFNEAVGTQNLSVSEIRNKITKNSDEFVLDQCSRIAQALKLPFDKRMKASEFLDDLRDQITQLRRKVTPSNETEETFMQLSNQVETSLAELKSLNSQIKVLEKQKNELKVKATTEPIPIVEDPTPIIEQHMEMQAKRTRKLRKSLEDALKITGYDWIIPKSQRDVCSTYVKLIRSMQNEIAALNREEEPVPDLTVLQSKVQAVRKQNREIRHRIKTIVTDKH
ncbi:hypothetical protein TRFO_20313 [Tritrichomonas foetus]|uniref:Uncharacterized protein n=1 Tax=Tritrichomonas foetus TaxID=1144522 RepID=A0A1J4KM32_9EUKA|nr:hypothetical protein TRFO_20313 [Tritrichomonas foetus]|eukprot:OHT10429.1 hypothetical protein TRFO_20313 [Tritrichomonas foetus]